MTKKEAQREAALERKARTHDLRDKAQVRLGIGKRLYCLIRRNKDGSISRYWVVRFTVATTKVDDGAKDRHGRLIPYLTADGKRHLSPPVREKSLGLIEMSTLEEARQRVLDEIAKPLHQGVADPIAKAKADKEAAEEAAKPLPTLGEVFESYIRAHRATWSNAKTVNQWIETAEEHCAAIADKPVADITKEHVLSVLEPQWARIPTTMSRVRSRIEAVLGYAAARGLRSESNPAMWRGAMKHLLASPQKLAQAKGRHHPALPYRQVADLMTSLAAKPGTVTLALRFTILTAARSGEVRLAKWDEIDLDAAIWTVPKERTKGRKQHVVPLSPQALDVLREAEKHRCGPFVFPGDVIAADGWRHPISEAAMIVSLRTLHPTATVHGTARSSFKDWAVEQTTFDNALSELTLAHKVGSAVELAYRRSDQRDQRRALMDAWANYIAPYPADNVVPLKRSA